MIVNSKAKGGKLKHIVTFNLDDLLEQHLQELKVECQSVVGPAAATAGCVDIVHPHGVIPQHGQIPEQELVFSEDEYHQMTIQPHHLALKKITSALSTSTVLCVGLSMTDPDLKRLIDLHQSPDHHHYIVRQDYDISRIDLEAAVDAIQNIAEREGMRRGIAAQKASKTEVENAIKQMLKQAHTYDRQLFKDLGCRIIWLKEYKDISALLDYISQ